MLKIKNNIELKQLEKFGFEYERMYGAYVKYRDTGLHTIHIFVNVSNHNFKPNEIHCNSSSVIDCVFKEDRIELLCNDLIEAGLVEKVGE